MEARVVVRNLNVGYGATTALDGVDLDVYAGEVHAVVGENGAGKSTLLRVLAGVVPPTAGTVASPASVAWVPQEILLPPELTAAEWIFLANELCGPFGWLRRASMHAAAAGVLREVGALVDAAARLGTLTAPQRKQVQLARAWRDRSAVMLLDEPTAVLGDAESRQLFQSIREVAARGTAVLYVSHRLDEVLAIADRVTVLRDGVRVSTDPIGAVDAHLLVHRMVGRDIAARARIGEAVGAALLQVTHLATAHVRGCSLTVHAGEVVGLAGLIGAGRSEILEAIHGSRPILEGRVYCATRPALVPEDRARKGLVPALSLRENVFLPAPRAWLDPRGERRVLSGWIDRLRIRTRSADAAIDALSGGNQQKVLLARALRHRPQLLLLDEPTAGIDVGAKAEIHELIRQLAAAGAAILLASSDLPELVVLCDRVIALRGGAVVGELTAAEAGEPRLAAMITGAAAA